MTRNKGAKKHPIQICFCAVLVVVFGWLLMLSTSMNVPMTDGEIARAAIRAATTQ